MRFIGSRRTRVVTWVVAGGAILATGALAATVGFWGVGSELAAGVSKEGILALRPGMAEAEVHRLLGEPLQKRERLAYETKGVGMAPTGEWEWIYAQPNSVGGGFTISVVTRAGALQSASVKRDDFGIYTCREGSCPLFWKDPSALDKLRPRL